MASQSVGGAPLVRGCSGWWCRGSGQQAGGRREGGAAVMSMGVQCRTRLGAASRKKAEIVRVDGSAAYLGAGAAATAGVTRNRRRSALRLQLGGVDAIATVATAVLPPPLVAELLQMKLTSPHILQTAAAFHYPLATAPEINYSIDPSPEVKSSINPTPSTPDPGLPSPPPATPHREPEGPPDSPPEIFFSAASLRSAPPISPPNVAPITPPGVPPPSPVPPALPIPPPGSPRPFSPPQTPPFPPRTPGPVLPPTGPLLPSPRPRGISRVPPPFPGIPVVPRTPGPEIVPPLVIPGSPLVA